MEKENVEIKPNTGLMKKTKVQLVEIILRKDERERDLLSDIKTLEQYKHRLKKEVDGYDKEVKYLKEQVAILKEDYQDECDANVEIVEKYKQKARKYKTILLVFVFLTLITGFSFI